jgi:hypothetical protein
MTDKASIIRSSDTQDKEDEGEQGNNQLKMLPLNLRHTGNNIEQFGFHNILL